MANPEHEEPLDGFDRLTVRLYRSGIMISAAGVGLLAGLSALHRPTEVAWLVCLAGVLLSATNVHLYDRRVRWVISGSVSLGAVLWVAGLLLSARILQLAGLGFVFVSLSGFALKEQFCFRIPGLKLVPLGLAGGLLPLVFGSELGAAVVYGITVIPLGILSLAKWRMPLHFDIGDKSRYQI